MNKTKLYLRLLAKTSLVVIFLSTFSSTIFGWGSGHESQADQIWRYLPKSFTSQFLEGQKQRFVQYYSHYPDYPHARCINDLAQPAGEYYRRVITKENFNAHDEMKVFPHFVEELRAGHLENALMWAGCLTHSIGDDGALNHPDVVWFASAALGRTGVKTDIGQLPDTFVPDHAYRSTYFSDTYRHFYDEQMNNYKPKIISANPQQVIRQIIINGRFLKEYVNANEWSYKAFVLQEQLNHNPSEQTKRAIAEVLAKVIVAANKKIIDTIATGIELAKQDKLIKFDIGAAQKKAKQYLAQRDSSQILKAKDMVALYGLWVDSAADGTLGVIISDVPGMVLTGKGPLGPKHHWTVGAVLRTLRDKNIAYQCISYEESLKRLRFDPGENPVLLVVTDDYKPNKSFEESLMAYINKGGHLLWVGGKVPESILQILPRSQFGFDDAKDKFKFPFPLYGTEQPVARFVRLADAKKFPVTMRLPEPSWNTFGQCQCMLFDDFDNTQNVKALLKLVTISDKKIVSISKQTPNGGKIVYLPWFMICPHMFTKNRVIHSAVHIKLDEIGTAFLVEALKEAGLKNRKIDFIKRGT